MELIPESVANFTYPPLDSNPSNPDGAGTLDSKKFPKVYDTPAPTDCEFPPLVISKATASIIIPRSLLHFSLPVSTPTGP